MFVFKPSFSLINRGFQWYNMYKRLIWLQLTFVLYTTCILFPRGHVLTRFFSKSNMNVPFMFQKLDKTYFDVIFYKMRELQLLPSLPTHTKPWSYTIVLSCPLSLELFCSRYVVFLSWSFLRYVFKGISMALYKTR